MTKIDIECYAIGKTSAHVLTDEEQRIIASSNVNLQNSTNVQQFNRRTQYITVSSIQGADVGTTRYAATCQMTIRFNMALLLHSI